MAELADYESFQALQLDLEAARENRLASIVRLVAELENNIAAFQKLLDHKKKSNESRRQLNTGKIASE
jgi:hypothetical protein